MNEIKESKTFQVKKKRCFNLTLTDGKQVIQAMELKPISFLNTKLQPGVKVLIIGPVKVSNKIILLEEKNIKVIGGEVEELLIKNAYENVLLRLLKRPETKTPKTDYLETPFEAQQQHNSLKPEPSAPININLPEKQAEVNEELKKLSIDDDDFDFAMLDEIDALERQILAQTSSLNKDTGISQQSTSIDLTEGENLLIKHPPNLTKDPPIIVEEHFSPAPSLQNPSDSSKISEEKKTTKFASNFYGDVKRQINLPEHHQEKQHPPQIDRNSKTHALLIPEAVKNSIINEEEEFDEHARKRKSNEILSSPSIVKSARLLSPELPKRIPTFLDDDYEFKIDNYNFITVDQYEKLKICDKLKRSFAFKIQVIRVIKLRAFQSEWLLKLYATDEWSKNTLEIIVHDSIVAKFANRSATEMWALHLKLKTHPQYYDDIKDVLDAINLKLQQDSPLMAIKMNFEPPNNYEILAFKLLQNTDENKRTIMLKIHEENIL